jgi:RHH-type proline utilization regulon transcriptional repressor/proline dehydrogenase/delta 1-pyrroline-5-carboxylate dehydrogenase
MFGAERKNSAGFDLANENTLREISAALATPRTGTAPLLAGEISVGQPVRTSPHPAQRSDIVGQLVEASAADVETALTSASNFAMDWQTTNRRCARRTTKPPTCSKPTPWN